MGRGFSELAVAVVMVMVMSLVVVAMVFVVSVEGSCGVVDDEGRAGACANRGDDGSWRGGWVGDKGENGRWHGVMGMGEWQVDGPGSIK